MLFKQITDHDGSDVSTKTTFAEKISLLNWTRTEQSCTRILQWQHAGRATICNFAAADWNKDGFTDLLICSEHAVFLMMNDGKDSFGFSQEIVGNVSSCEFLKALDFDSDGDVDLIVDSRYFERMGSGESDVEERIHQQNPLQILEEKNRLWAVEDWDNDGDLDLLVRVTGEDDEALFLIQQLSDGTFREQAENPFRGFFSLRSHYVGTGRNYLADLNGDGLLDLWQMGGPWDDCTFVDRRARSIDQVLVEHRISENPTNPFLQHLDLLGDEVHWVDWNLDGLMDLVLARAQCNGLGATELMSYSRRSCYTHSDGPAIRYFQGQADGSLKESKSVFHNVDAAGRVPLSLGSQ